MVSLAHKSSEECSPAPMSAWAWSYRVNILGNEIAPVPERQRTPKSSHGGRRGELSFPDPRARERASKRCALRFSLLDALSSVRQQSADDGINLSLLQLR